MARACRQADGPLGLVPTMGALHDGHLALVRRAREENKTVAATIFVNPAQFGPGEDLELYPRDLPRDLDLLREERVDLVFTPGPDDLYPPGFSTWIDVGEIGGKLEGAVRPGHFRGVATVVAKLFSIVRPDRAYFGQKDGQQTVVVRQLVRDLNLGLEIVVVPNCARTRRLGPQQPQRLPHAGAAPGRPRSLPGAVGVRGPLAGRRTGRFPVAGRSPDRTARRTPGGIGGLRGRR